MGLLKFFFLSNIIFFFILSHPLSAQIIFKELPDYHAKIDSSFFNITKTRKIILLNGNWKVYPANNNERKSSDVTVPSIFNGKAELIFEKEFSIIPGRIKKLYNVYSLPGNELFCRYFGK